ncbi:EspA/EspE family type VII secretion system effector [Mycolicibacterium sp. A43C]
MTLLNAFLDTWSHARKTFGAGAPSPGAQFDQSAALRGLQSQVQGAAPGELWRGTAADAYAAVNADHAAVLGAVADLDVRLAVEVDRSASVVTAGRDDLEAVRAWVVAAASSVPASRGGDVVMMSVVSSGLAQVSQIVARANSELSGIGASIQKLGAEYSALGNQKFGVRGPVPENPANIDDEKPYDPRPIVDAATWRMEWEQLRQDIDAYNTSVREFNRRPRPGPNDFAGVAAYNQEIARQQIRSAELQRRQLEMVQKAAELGLPEPQISAPEGSLSYGAAPSGLVSRDRQPIVSVKGMLP